MSRRLWAGAIFAPTVICVSATAVFLDLNRSGETLGQRLTQASIRVNQLRAELNGQRAPAPRIEIARAPEADRAAGPAEPRPTARVLTPNTPLAALSVDPVASLPPASRERAPVEDTQAAGDTKPLPEETAPRAEILAPVVAEIPPSPLEPMPVIAVAREELPAPLQPAPVIAVAREEIPAPVVAESKPAPLEPVPVVEVAREEIPAPAPVVTAEVVREDKPAPEVTVAREEKPEPKTIFAGLGLGGSAMAATAPASVAAVPEPPAPVANKPEPVQVASLDLKAVGTQPARADAPAVPATTDVTPAELPEPTVEQAETDPGQIDTRFSAPLRMRALTRADLLPQEKLASLRSSTQPGSLPAEQQRVAYDEPVFTEVPVSVGKRKWIDESKYKGLGSPEALLEALKHLGANAKSLGLPASLWCADFMNLVLRKSGVPATGSRAARSYLQYGQKIDEPRVGAIAIFSRGRNSGHVGIVRGTDGNGNPIIVSGNHGHKVAESVYPKSRVIAYVVPK
jgi:uncharacterized protein (TIGR02594 family)